jgi:putative hydrolase of the HAD superfamily
MKALLLDLDDTLLDYSGGVDECWAGACHRVAAPAGVDPVRLIPQLARSRRWLWDDPVRHRMERTDMMGAWTKIVAHALAEVGAERDGLAAEVAEAYAESRWRRMALYPGVREALTCLRARGLPMALVTNGDARQQRRKIEQYELAPYFDVIVIEGEFGAGKPDEAVYRHVLGALRVPAARAWMVGDNLEWDVAAPQRLGLSAAWIDGPGRGLPDGSAVKPDRILRAFPELLDDVKASGGGR